MATTVNCGFERRTVVKQESHVNKVKTAEKIKHDGVNSHRRRFLGSAALTIAGAQLRTIDFADA
jgi:hypothetical protein